MEFSDGFLERNCHCGAGVYVLVDEYHGQCGVCGSTKLTQKGANIRDRETRIKMGLEEPNEKV